MPVYIGSTKANSNYQENKKVNIYLGQHLISKEVVDSIDNYQLVEWIASDGKQRIDTKVKPTTTLKTQMKFRITHYEGGWFYGGGDHGYHEYDENDYRFFRGADGKTYFDMLKGRISSSFVSSTSATYEIELGNYYVKNLANGQIVMSDSKQSFTWYTNNTIELFTSTDYGRIYYLKIYDNNILIRNFVPCYRKSDGVIGLYDKVNNKFYRNKGTGTFTKGNNI